MLVLEPQPPSSAPENLRLFVDKVHQSGLEGELPLLTVIANKVTCILEEIGKVHLRYMYLCSSNWAVSRGDNSKYLAWPV